MGKPGDVDEGSPSIAAAPTRDAPRPQAPGPALVEAPTIGKLRAGGGELAAHRPLPSVQMALLPHEVRAARSRQAAVLTALGLVVAGGALATVGWPWVAAFFSDAPMPAFAWPASEAATPPEPNAASAPPMAAVSPAANAADEDTAPARGTEVRAEALGMAVEATPEAPEEAETVAVATPVADTSPAVQTPDGLTRVTRPFGKARGFRDALTNAGASAADADALIAALTKVVDFRRGKPEHTLTFERDAKGTLVAFEYQASLTERYRAERKPNGQLVGRKVQVPVEHRRIVAGGYVADSLGRALEALGVKSSAAGMFVEAFEGKIDFKRHARQGDSFRIILDEDFVEGQSLGYGRVHALQYEGSRSGDAYAFWYETAPGEGDFYDEHGRGLHGGWLRTPLRYDHLSSPFDLHRRHPILHRIMPHNGIDYAASPGTTVWAAADGVVTFAGARGPNGNLISISHANGYETFYAHLLRTARGITKGAHVKQRQPIGAVGSTGRSTGPHLHFSLKRNGRFIDPAIQLNGPGKLLAASHLQRFKQVAAQLKRELANIHLAAAPAPVGASADPDEEFHEDSLEP